MLDSRWCVPHLAEIFSKFTTEGAGKSREGFFFALLKIDEAKAARTFVLVNLPGTTSHLCAMSETGLRLGFSQLSPLCPLSRPWMFFDV